MPVSPAFFFRGNYGRPRLISWRCTTTFTYEKLARVIVASGGSSFLWYWLGLFTPRSVKPFKNLTLFLQEN
jgi:hypothetical protein